MMGHMTTPTPLTAQTMERLAFIRMLHQQAVDQSRLPEPLNFTSILAFHDAIELFLILSAEHRGATLPEKKPFTDKFYSGINQVLPAGTNLDAERGVRRITDARNSFKHAHNWPSLLGIQQAREDAALFFQANTPKVFGISYEEIDMADLVTHGDAHKKLKEASSAWSSGDLTEGMALLVDAFASLFRSSPLNPSSKSPFSFGDDIHYPLDARKITAVLWQPEHSSRRTVPTRGAEQLGDQLHSVTTVVAQMQTAMRVMAIGIDYREQYRFDQLTPHVGHTYGGRYVRADEDYAPSVEDFVFCKRFVITVALRLAELGAFALPSHQGR